jgi:hypothetical protein
MKAERNRIKNVVVVVAALVLWLDARLGVEASISQECDLKLRYLSEIVVDAWAWGSEAPATVEGPRLYAPLGYPGLAIIDFSDPLSPEVVCSMGSQELGGQAGALAASGDRLFVSLPVSGTIALVDISDVDAPSVLGDFGSFLDLEQLQVQGSHLFVFGESSVAYPGGVHAFDISTQIPVEVGEYEVDLTDPGFLVTADGIVFVARGPAAAGDPSGVDVIDMSDPASPLLLAQWRTTAELGNVWDIAYSENRVYLAAYWGGLWVLDVSDLTSPQLVGTFDWDDPEPYALSVKAAPPNVFIARGGPSLQQWALDLFCDDPEGLQLIESIPTNGNVARVYLSGELLILEELLDTDGDHWLDAKRFTFYHVSRPYVHLPPNVPIGRER